MRSVEGDHGPKTPQDQPDKDNEHYDLAHDLPYYLFQKISNFFLYTG
jgi:hypothetical protein